MARKYPWLIVYFGRISKARDGEENDRKKEGFLRIIDHNNFHGGVDWYISWNVANQLTDCIDSVGHNSTEYVQVCTIWLDSGARI